MRRQPHKYQMFNIMVLYIPWAQHLLNYKSYVITWGYKDSYFPWQGFSYGFKLQYMGPRLLRRSDNLSSLHVNSQIAQTKIQKEVFLKRVAGPFDFPPVSNLQASPLDLGPEKDGDMLLLIISQKICLLMIFF